MVYLALTPQGLRDVLVASEAAKTPIWCSADALSEEEFEKLERGNITRSPIPLQMPTPRLFRMHLRLSKSITRANGFGLKAPCLGSERCLDSLQWVGRGLS